ncbi:transglutaminase domain-containing protein [Paenibacillus sp. N3.4]|uniref:transglutaminase domain-containing protein n=1 Tax=Paenibacillus sp. N3.4 TaxID=2603222 RepID=UPI0011C938EE|nr:transglutaminase domain-containing protein [Paenibacillus sp. N3.4]TXK81468.1 transglutaminase [Paenibacillus sp. N3.4]
MKTWVKRLFICSTLLGTFTGVTTFIPSFSVYAASSSTAQDQLQQDISDALDKRLPAFQVTYTGTNAKSLKTEISNALNAAINKDDYMHYTVKTYNFSATMKGNTATVDFKLTYWETLAQTGKVQERVAEILQDIVTTDMNDHQKEKAIHDWIVGHIAYDTKLIAHSAYDGLIHGKTVCQGYALITYEMMKQAGIPVKIVEGSSRGIPHAWNLVKIDGKWYQLDCTWDDPVPDIAGRVLYNYYNLTDAQLRVDHTWKASAAYPTASASYDQTLNALAATDPENAVFYNKLYTAIGYDYLAEANTATNLEALTGRISSALAEGQEQLVIRYLKGATVTSDLKKALAAQKSIYSYSYTSEAFTRTTTNDKLLTITFNYNKK